MYKLLLCVRYLRTRYIALASIISVMLGVATMIVVNSVLAGFTGEMRDRIHGFLADIVLEARHSDGIEDSADILRTIEETVGSDIAAMTPTVEVPALMRFEYHGQAYPIPVALVGILPSSKAKVGPLKQYLASYQPRTVNGLSHPPLRSDDEPVGWELTADAVARRRTMIEMQKNWLETQGLTPSADNVPEPVFEEDTTEFSTDEDTPESSLDDALIAAPDLFNDDPEENTDPLAPLAARVFVGGGIISYPYRHPETGELERAMYVNPGDDVTLSVFRTGVTGKPEIDSFDATVCDVFQSGMSEYDSKLVLMNLQQLQKYLGMLHTSPDGTILGDAVTSIQIKINDYNNADEVVRKLKAVFPPELVSIKTWESKQGLLLSAVEMETAILNVLLFLIITVAGFGILAIFFMIVVEKTRDIGVLKSLGASSRGVMSIFLSYGLGLGIVGSAAGVTIGLLFVRYINEIEAALSLITGRRVFDRDIYYFDSIPTLVSPFMVMWVAAGAIAIAVLASVLPARRAARLHPVRALRFD